MVSYQILLHQAYSSNWKSLKERRATPSRKLCVRVVYQHLLTNPHQLWKYEARLRQNWMLSLYLQHGNPLSRKITKNCFPSQQSPVLLEMMSLEQKTLAEPGRGLSGARPCPQAGDSQTSGVCWPASQLCPVLDVCFSLGSLTLPGCDVSLALWKFSYFGDLSIWDSFEGTL